MPSITSLRIEDTLEGVTVDVSSIRNQDQEMIKLTGTTNGGRGGFVTTQISVQYFYQLIGWLQQNAN